MLPPHQLQNHEELSEPSLIRDKTRPDVMIVELTLEEQRTYCNAKCNAVLPNLSTNIKHSCKRRRVWILEVGYNSDTKYEEKFQEKTQQHQPLVNALTQWGYDVHLRPLPLGFAGTIYKSNPTTLADLGITRYQSLSVLRKLHIHAITCLHNIIKGRRYLERCTRNRKSQTRETHVTTRRGQG